MTIAHALSVLTMSMAVLGLGGAIAAVWRWHVTGMILWLGIAFLFSGGGMHRGAVTLGRLGLIDWQHAFTMLDLFSAVLSFSGALIVLWYLCRSMFANRAWMVVTTVVASVLLAGLALTGMHLWM